MTFCHVYRCKLKVNVHPALFFKRFKSRKEKFAVRQAVKSNAELALGHYDIHLGNILAARWPSIRLALLSQPKYCAVMNNLCDDHDAFVLQLAEKGGFDFVSRFKPVENYTGKYSLLSGVECEDDDIIEKIDDAIERKDHDGKRNNNAEGHGHEIREASSMTSSPSMTPMTSSPSMAPMTSSPSDLLSFMPGERVLSGRESMMRREGQMLQASSPTSPLNHADDDVTDESVSMTTADTFQYPHKLKAILHTKADLTDFLPAKRDPKTGKLSYYLMDAGSILPVLALDLFPSCHVLDMCAAPGGKTFAMLQTMLPGSIVCLDRSYSRLVRLKNSLRAFFPQSYSLHGDNRVEVKTRDATMYGHNNPDQFDRVLVDVPCYADRHTLADVNNEDNTLFKSSRQQDRISMQALQQQLLVSALKACKPGGLVVYSTCTLFPSQNDVVVRTGVQQAYHQLGVEAEVVDTGKLAEAYEDFFCFEPGWKGKLGQLVVPNMVANFGPTYFCKIRRTK